MNKKVIFGAAFATAALLSFKVFSSFATAGNTANITGGSNWDICVSTSTNYNGSRFTADISATGFESQIVFDGFNNQACKTVKLDSGSYTVTLNNPMLTDNVSYTISGTTLTYTVSDLNSKYINNYGSLDYETKASIMEVTFDANGGSGTMSNQQFTVGTADTLTANAFTGTGAFDGWNTAADGSGTGYTDGQSVTFTEGGELTLYAQWNGSDPCSSPLLYHTIECIALTRNANDANLDFTASIDKNDPDENGVFILDEKKNEQYPVYYYRGDAVNQHVVWSGMCWNIYRTTETGGVKMVYYGEAVNNGGVYSCGSQPDTYLDADNQSDAYMTMSYNYSLAMGGYMYGDLGPEMDYLTTTSSNTFSFSEEISYSNGTYTLDGDIVTGTTADYSAAAQADHHYFCPDGSTSCSNAVYFMDIFENNSSVSIMYLTLGGQADIEAAKAAAFSNTTDSTAKAMIDQWYDDNLLSNANDLEDTPFCNDRQFTSGTLAGESAPVNNLPYSNPNFPDYGTSYFAGSRTYEPFLTSSYRPTLSCDNQNDTFMIDSTVGNGELTRPIALPTTDEQLLTGYTVANGADQVMLYGYTMTPVMATHADWNSIGEQTNRIGYADSFTTVFGGSPLHPMVSLKYGIEIVSGTGSLSDPYIVQ